MSLSIGKLEIQLQELDKQFSSLMTVHAGMHLEQRRVKTAAQGSHSGLNSRRLSLATCPSSRLNCQRK